MEYFLIVIFIPVLLGFIAWLGLRVRPAAFRIPPLSQGEIETLPLPQGLPAPVERFYRAVYGDRVPRIETAVVVGRGRMRPFGVWLPARFIIVHHAGRDYRHYFEAAFFGLPFLKVNEGYLDGASFFESPMGTYTDDPNTNQGANLALWAEGAWFPALWITDPRCRWQPVDDRTALLVVPFEDAQENFVVRFNPRTGLIEMMEAMRFRAPKDEHKVLWITSEVRFENRPSVSYATWLDAGQPWAAFILDQIEFNLDAGEYIRARGI